VPFTEQLAIAAPVRHDYMEFFNMIYEYSDHGMHVKVILKSIWDYSLPPIAKTVAITANVPLCGTVL